MLQLRKATKDDVPLILSLIRALAEYEREPEAVVATEAGLLRDGFGPQRFYECLIADWDGKPAGFALWYYNYSTWTGSAGIHLEDLFVYPELRGKGIGKALLAQVAAVAHARGCQRLQWQVLDWNTPAIEFYRSLGVRFLDEWRNVRMEPAAIARLAALAPGVSGASGSGDSGSAEGGAE